MRRFCLIFAVLLLLVFPALAASSVYAPPHTGICLSISDWASTLGERLYVDYDHIVNEKAVYSYLLFATPVDNTITPVFMIVNYVKGPADLPVDFDHSEVLKTENGCELALYYNDAPDGCDDLSRRCFTVPVEWLIEHPEDLTVTMPDADDGFSALSRLSGINAMTEEPVSAEVYRGHSLTMVNMWATYCNPCIKEMPDLGKLNAVYADKGVQIIGFVTDIGTSEAPKTDSLETARMIIEKTGADYVHVIPSVSIYSEVNMELEAVPTTYFVNENGDILGEPYVGSRSYDEWEKIIIGLLNEVNAQ